MTLCTSLICRKDFRKVHNAALRCERRLAILERSETAKRCESLLNALLEKFTSPYLLLGQTDSLDALQVLPCLRNSTLLEHKSHPLPWLR